MTRAQASTWPGRTSSPWPRSFGIDAELVTDPGQPLADALGRAFAAKAPRLVVLDAELTPPRTTSPRWRDG